MCRWIIDNSLIEYIFTDSNPEMISRTSSLIELLANCDALTDDHISLLWNTCVDEHKHEAVTKQTLDLIAAIAKKLPDKHLDTIFEQIAKLKNADELMLNFIKEFYASTNANVFA